MRFVTDPWDWWVAPFVDNPFMQRALWAGLLTALTTSVVGTWVVLRGMTFLGDALAHGVLPGIAIAFLLGQSTTAGALVAAALMIGGISLVRSHSPLPDDASIGILFVGFLALAVVVMSTRRAAYTGDLNRFLFGSISGVESGELARQAVIAGIVVVGVAVLYRALVVMTFDETLAKMLGLRPRLTHFVLLALVAFSIVGSFATVGNLLVFAFLVAPPAAAALVARRVPIIMVVAVGLGSVASVLGLLISYHHRTAAGASMALASVVLFFVVLLVTSARRGLRATRAQATQSAHAP
jgi:ABC-type Mn2+/Zn2+ transport system permease subunit